MGEARQEVAISLNGLARRPCVCQCVSNATLHSTLGPFAVALCWLFINQYTLLQVLCLLSANNFVVDR